eukprot:678636_1
MGNWSSSLEEGSVMIPSRLCMKDRDTLCIQGFMRRWRAFDGVIDLENIPNDIIHSILLMYHIPFDAWNPCYTHPCFSIDTAANTIELHPPVGTDKLLYFRACGTIVIGRGQIQTWKIR